MFVVGGLCVFVGGCLLLVVCSIVCGVPGCCLLRVVVCFLVLGVN